MCFSPAASFIAGSALLAGGVVSARSAGSPKEYLFASIPFIFSIQQFSEGVVWLSLLHPEFQHLLHFNTYFFFIIAQVAWPLWVPLSFYLMEKDGARKKALSILLLIGLIVSSYLGYCIYKYEVVAMISNLHIHYEHEFSHHLIYLKGVFYAIVTIIPPFLSTMKKASMLGIINLLSFIVSVAFFEKYVISVWCFFAAVISLLVIYVLRSSNVIIQQPKIRV